MNEGRRADGQKEIAGGCREALAKDIRIDRLPEPDHAGPRKSSAAWTGWWKSIERRRIVTPSVQSARTPIPATELPDGAMKPNDVPGDGAFVKIVDVLSDQGEVVESATPMGDDVVRPVGFAGSDMLAAPVISFPHQYRVTRECVGRRQLFRTEGPPEVLGTSKRRNPTRGRDPGSS